MGTGTGGIPTTDNKPETTEKIRCPTDSIPETTDFLKRLILLFKVLSHNLRGTSDLGNARVKVDMLSYKFSYEKNS
jgi:hypothetical protein